MSGASGRPPIGDPVREGALQSGAARRRGRGGNLRRGAILASLVVLVGVVVAGVALALAVRATVPDLRRAETLSVSVVDNRGRLLRAYTTAGGLWRLPVKVADVDPRYIEMLLAYEDRRFREHVGVDPLATLRAAGQLLWHQRIISGASTLTMQVARLLDDPAPRSFATKMRQAVMALALEQRFTKDQILELYLRLAPFGGNLEGVRAASLAYFGKEPQRLSIAERALLVAIPQSPATRRPDRSPKAARRARDRALDRAAAAGVISEAEAAQAKQRPIPTLRRAFPQWAPHLADAVASGAPHRTEHRLTIDRDRQVRLEALVSEHAKRVGPALSAALIAVENRTGRVIALVGSPGYLDTQRQGAIDMTEAVRSPGSTLKPFIYGLAFERGLAHPETHIEDRPSRFGRYVPSNFDEDFHGTVTVREALALSLNIPAVKVLAEVGPKRLVARLKRAGADPKLPEDAEPSLAVALGGVGLTLRDLAQLYAAIPRGGEVMGLKFVVPDETGPGQAARPIGRLLSPVAAWYVADILKGVKPPEGARAQQIAYKTGTSYGYRDAWAVGFDGRYTVAAWVGRADASSTPGLTGHTAAAPLLFDAFARLTDRITPLAGPPRGVIRSSNAELPLPLRRFNAGTTGETSEPPVTIAFPPDKAELETDAGAQQEIVLKADGGSLPLTWLVDGKPLATDPDSRNAVWTPDGPGFARISVVDAHGRADRVLIRLRTSH